MYPCGYTTSIGEYSLRLHATSVPPDHQSRNQGAPLFIMRAGGLALQGGGTARLPKHRPVIVQGKRYNGRDRTRDRSSPSLTQAIVIEGSMTRLRFRSPPPRPPPAPSAAIRKPLFDAKGTRAARCGLMAPRSRTTLEQLVSKRLHNAAEQPHGGTRHNHPSVVVVRHLQPRGKSYGSSKHTRSW
jgi:hypothetical protein